MAESDISADPVRAASIPSLKPEARYQPLLWACRIVAIVLGMASAWVSRYTMYPDGVSYLDVGDAFWRGDWHNAINAYWSPLYALILGFFMKIVKPSIRWEYPLVHLVNLLLYVVALICFDYFLRTFLDQEERRRKNISARLEMSLPAWCWTLLGFSAFVISSLSLITISFVSGDMIVAAVIYFASALIFKIQQRQSNASTFALLGLVLGLGYLAKAAMFLMAMPFIVIAAATQETMPLRLRSSLICFVCFLVISGPFVMTLSFLRGRPTFGDSGKINYLMNVGSTQFFTPHEPDAIHPVHKLTGLANAYEYATPVPGTYPLWYDPSYWHEGIHSHFGFKRQIRTLLLALAELGFILLSPKMGLCVTAAILFLYLVAPSFGDCFARACQNWALWIPAIAGIGVYSLVVILPRYIAGLVCVLWSVGYSGVQLPDNSTSRRLITGATLAVVALTLLGSSWEVFAARNGTVFARMDVATPVCVDAAEALVANGIRPGDQIALIAPWLFPSRQGAYIARLARARIIAEARPEEYWAADERTRDAIGSEFAAAGAKAIITSDRPTVETGWSQIPNTDYYLYMLR